LYYPNSLAATLEAGTTPYPPNITLAEVWNRVRHFHYKCSLHYIGKAPLKEIVFIEKHGTPPIDAAQRK
jgi:hypothetical protein